MATITVTAGPLEFGIFEEQWSAFEADLRAAGHDVALEQPDEYRSGGGAWLPPDWPDGATVVIVIWLAKELAGETVSAVVAEVRAVIMRRIKGRARGNPNRVVVLLGPRGERLLDVEVPIEEDDER